MLGKNSAKLKELKMVMKMERWMGRAKAATMEARRGLTSAEKKDRS